MPYVSVIMPVYNSARWLRPALDSVLAQTFTDFEFICVDDGSTDASPQILAEYAARDPRVRVIRQANGGVAAASNAGLAAAQGRYIARLDSDDIALPERLAKQVAYLDAHPDVVLISSAYELIDQDDRLLTTHVQPSDDAELQRRCLVGTIPIANSGCAFPRELAVRLGGYDLALPPAEDLDMFLRLGEHGKMACLPDILLRYRQHANSLSESRQQTQMDNMRIACERAWKRRGLTNMRFEGKPWRAVGSDPRSLYDQHTRFGWWSFNSGSREGARHYGWAAIRLRPFQAEGWKLLAAGLLKRAGGHPAAGRAHVT